MRTGLNLAAVAAEAMNRGASQVEAELAAVLTLISAHEPLNRRLVIVEIGCDRGGTLYAWRQLDAAVYGITLADNSYDAGGSGQPLEPHGAEVLIADSHSQEAYDWLYWAVDGWIDVLVIDGDHKAAGVRQDLTMYGPMVRPGGLVLIHDIAPTPDPRGAEVPGVWRQIKPRYKTREVRCAPAGFGWGVIHVRQGDVFTEEETDGQEGSADRPTDGVRGGRQDGAPRSGRPRSPRR